MTSKPDAIITKHLIRNVLVTLVLVVIGVCGFLWWRSYSNRKPSIDSAPVAETPHAESQEIVEAESPYILNVEDAKSALSDYYTLLSQGEFAGLRSRGFNEAASSVELGWTRQIGMEIHPELLVPDVPNMPEPVGTYAGNDLYDIKSFFATVPPTQSVKTIVTGETGPVGWIYHDAIDGQWHIIDPTVPLSTQAPVASNQIRKSNDGLVLVEMSSSGIFCNQWWAITMFTVSVTSASKVTGVSVMPRSFDDGVTVEVPESLTKGITTAEVPLVPTTNPDGTTNPLVAKVYGVCTIWRGERQSFDAGLIGQTLQHLDGSDMSPVEVTAGAENITPVFPVDNRLAETTANLLNEEQAKRYGVDGVIVTMSLADQQSYEQDALGIGQPVDTAQVDPVAGNEGDAYYTPEGEEYLEPTQPDGSVEYYDEQADG